MKTILLVDDEYAFVESLSELFQHQGYRVVSAGNGKDGLARFEADKPDLVITDLMMPIMDGRELIRSIAAMTTGARVPIILISATTRPVALVDAKGHEVAVAAFLRKPIQWKRLYDLVVEIIGPGGHSEAGPV
jgi:CheY-like chemotaxis protein